MGNLRALIAGKLEAWELRLLHSSYDIVGDIAIIRLPETMKHRRETIAEAIMQTNKHVKTVLCQAGPVSGDYRLRELEWVAGERKTETVHREYGCVFKVDLERCYFSPRLSYERMRIAQQVRRNEAIVNMFSGVGCYSIVIAKHSEAEKIYSIDINSVAIRCMKENIGLNRARGRVIPLLGDAKDIIEEKLRNTADRVLMPLPEKAYEYLDYAVLALKLKGGCIHYYDFVHAKKGENPVEKTEAEVSEKLRDLNVQFEMLANRIVRTTGPNWYQVVLDVRIL